MSSGSPIQQRNSNDTGVATTFLGEVAKQLVAENGADMASVAVILPNSRGVQYLKEEIRKAKPACALLLPSVYGMDEWVKLQNQCRIMDTAEALIFFYRAFQKVRNAEETFDTFFSLGQILLADFEEITRNQRPVELIYRNLAEWEAVGINFTDFLTEEQKTVLSQFWSHFDEANMTQLRRRFLGLWRSLPGVYHEFERLLKEEQALTSAMAYAALASDFTAQPWLDSHSSVWFVGFGDLSQTETTLLENIERSGKLRLFWDVNDLFSNNPVHEVNRLFSRLQKVPVLSDTIAKARAKSPGHQPEVEYVYCQGIAGMGQWLRQHTQHTNRPDVALILTDTSLIQHLIQQADFENEKYNFTMGYPLAYTQAVAWLYCIIAWAERERIQEVDLLKPVVRNSLFYKLLPNVSARFNKEMSQMEIWPDLAGLKLVLGNAPSWFWQTEARVWLNEFRTWWKTILPHTYTEESTGTGFIHLHEALAELSIRLTQLPDSEFSWKTLRLLLPLVLYRHPVQLSGDIHTGTQVMGLYESRVLNFKELVIAPAEEGKIPSGTKAQTFLTENVRRAFGLPTRLQRFEDELYQFYRHCYRSSKITLLVDKSADTKPSRLLSQIRYSGIFQLTEIQQEYGHSLPVGGEIKLAKNDSVAEHTSRYFRTPEKPERKALSPSSLHDLIACPLRFFYKHVERLEPPDDPNNLEMNPADFGNWVHETIQRLYEKHPPLGRFLNETEYSQMITSWETEKFATWQKLYPDTLHPPLTQFPIEMAVGRTMMYRFFSHMATQEPHRWIAQEKILKRAFLGENGLSSPDWAIEGRADLIFETENEHWIVDLKTGTFQSGTAYFVKPEKLENLESRITDNKELLQMLVYNWLNTKAFSDKPTRAFLFHLANPEARLIDPLRYVSIGEEWEMVFHKFWSIVASHLDQWINLTRPISQTDDAAICQYCDFKAICQR